MNTKRICLQLEKNIFNKLGILVEVKFGEVPNLNNWFYVERRNFDGYYRLGMFESSSKSFIKSLSKEDVPEDLLIK